MAKCFSKPPHTCGSGCGDEATTVCNTYIDNGCVEIARESTPNFTCPPPPAVEHKPVHLTKQIFWEEPALPWCIVPAEWWPLDRPDIARRSSGFHHSVSPLRPPSERVLLRSSAASHSGPNSLCLELQHRYHAPVEGQCALNSTLHLEPSTVPLTDIWFADSVFNSSVALNIVLSGSCHGISGPRGAINDKGNCVNASEPSARSASGHTRISPLNHPIARGSSFPKKFE